MTKLIGHIAMVKVLAFSPEGQGGQGRDMLLSPWWPVRQILLAYNYHLVHIFVSGTVKPADKKQRMDHFFAAHRESGLPVTTQRCAVFEAILDRADHPTAEQLYRAVRGELPQISRMTVHRVLNTFVSLGLVAKTCHPGSAVRFDPKLHQHHHLVCLDCGRIIDLEDPRLNHIPWPKVSSKEFQIEDYHVHFRGRCAQCCEKPNSRQRRPNAEFASVGTKDTLQ